MLEKAGTEHIELMAYTGHDWDFLRSKCRAIDLL